MHLDEIIRYFDKPKPNGANSYMVRCPCHDDKQQSLSVTEKNGKILINCFAGCSPQDILMVSGLKEKDLFNDSPNRKAATDKPQSVEYNYGHDLKKVRFYTKTADGWQKTFYWKHLDENGEWQNGMGDKTPPLYQQFKLDLVRRRAEKPADSEMSEDGDLFTDEPWTTVFIVEGEKDADTLNLKLEMEAVCSPHGGSKGDLKSKWRAEYNPLFEGLDVAIIPDNDEVGRQFASMVAQQVFPYAKSVRIVDLKREWPDLKEKGDITDVYENETPSHGRTLAEQVSGKLEALTLSADILTEEQIPAAEAKPDEKGTDEWEPPVPFTDYKLPEFPVDALPPVIRAYAVSAAESVQVPVDMCASACLAVLALAVQGKYRIMGKPDWTEPLNLYVLCIAKPSERKSSIISKVTKPVNEYESEYNDLHAAEFEKNRIEYAALKREREELIKKIATERKSGNDISELGDKVTELADEIANFVFKVPLKLYVDDVTPEKLEEEMSLQGDRIALLSSEGGIFNTLSGQYSNTKSVNINVFLQAWSGDSIRVGRVSREGCSMSSAALTILLMIQPHVISGVLQNSSFRGRGLTARFLYCMPKSAVGHRRYRTEPIPPQVSENYHSLIHSLLDDEVKEEPRMISLSREADLMMEEFSEKLEPKILHEYVEIDEWSGKLAGTVLRIAGILTRAKAAERDTDQLNGLIVSGETMQAAIAIGEYFVEHTRSAFMLMGADEVTEKAKYVLGKIQDKKLTEFNHKKILDICRTIPDVETLTPVLDKLIDFGWLKNVTPEWSGRGRPPAAKYLVNPAALEQHDNSKSA